MGKARQLPALLLLAEGCVPRHNPEQQEAATALPNSLAEFSLPSLFQNGLLAPNSLEHCGNREIKHQREQGTGLRFESNRKFCRRARNSQEFRADSKAVVSPKVCLAGFSSTCVLWG